MAVNIKNFILRFILPLVAICLPFLLMLYLTENRIITTMLIFVAVCGIIIYAKGLHRVDFNPDSRNQKAVFALIIAVLVITSFFLCAVSIEKEWLHSYPLEGSIDDYGCYPQMFDAFQKGQLNIDTDYDLSVLEALENPYNTAERRNATGEKFGVIWDRAYYEGKLYSYFGIAPVIFLYYPVYFITGAVLSDALAAAIMVGIACIFLSLILWELCRRLPYKIPFLLLILGAITLPCGSLLWATETCANFYHLAVLSGICAVSSFFWLILVAERSADGFWRKALFAFAGISVAAIVASRPNMVIYVIIALPLLISIIIKHKNGIKSLFADIAAFCLPMFMLGGLIMAYNYARFGSPFDFGSNYQLTLTDTSTYKFSSTLILPAFFHYFINPPLIDDVFPYIHPNSHKLADYGVKRLVYTDKTVGALYFPAVWGCVFLPLIRKHKIKLFTGVMALISVVIIAIFDMVYAGVHLRYSADIMFILTLMGVYLLVALVGKAKKGSLVYTAIYTAVIILFALTVVIEIPLCFDNERDMILKYHKEFYNLFKL